MQSRVFNLELSVSDVHSAIDEEFHLSRRQQINYDARRRRLINRLPELADERNFIRLAYLQLRDIDRRIALQWDRETRNLWMGPSFLPMKRERSLILRRLRRRERLLETAVEAELGQRPDINDGDEASFFRAVARLGGSRLANQISENDDSTENQNA